MWRKDDFFCHEMHATPLNRYCAQIRMRILTEIWENVKGNTAKTAMNSKQKTSGSRRTLLLLHWSAGAHLAKRTAHFSFKNKNKHHVMRWFQVD